MVSQATPEWLNEEFLLFCLKEKVKGKEDLKIVSFTSEQAVLGGENFMSSIKRVKVEYSVKSEMKTTTLIVKYPPEGKIMGESYTIRAHKENYFYSTILPEIKNIFNLSITPEPFTSPVPSVIVVEDLKVFGYKMKDRKTLLDFEHCKAYLEALAKLHATGSIVTKRNAKLVENLKASIFLEYGESWQFFVKSSLKCLADFIETREEFKVEHEVIRTVTESLWNLILDFLNNPTTFKTIIHGDCWTNNAMFQYDASGKVKSVKTFDLQCCSFSPAVIDLVFVIWLSSNNDVRENRLEELYHFYCDTLNSTLLQLGSDFTLTYSKLKEEITLASPLILYCVGFRLPGHLFDGVFDMDGLVKRASSDGMNVFNTFHRGKFYTNVFPQVLKQMSRDGVFDYLKRTLNG